MTGTNALLEGYKRFYSKYFLGDDELYRGLAKGQSPKTLIIGCSDSRVDPSILLDARPGDIFIVRNVANLVPPYQPMNDSYHGTSAALEFAVNHVGVENIVVLGHSGCAGIKALMDSDENQSDEFSFVSDWVKIGKKAKEKTLKKCSHDNDDKYPECEKQSINNSIQNLLTFPWIKEKLANNTIQLHGWYFSISDGKLYVLEGDEWVGVVKEQEIPSPLGEG